MSGSVLAIQGPPRPMRHGRTVVLLIVLALTVAACATDEPAEAGSEPDEAAAAATDTGVGDEDQAGSGDNNGQTSERADNTGQTADDGPDTTPTDESTDAPESMEMVADEPDPADGDTTAEGFEQPDGDTGPTETHAGGSPTSNERTNDLLAAGDRFATTVLGPHAYLIVSVDGVRRDLYLQSTGPGGHNFVPPEPQATLLNPFTIHDELITAIDAGRDVEFELDAGSGLPTWWTVDGATTTVICFEVDTAPPDLRVGPCDPFTDLIGR
ncbi:MAG: hypothetical protein AAF531_09910 [Actinomycetota bacterium]